MTRIKKRRSGKKRTSDRKKASAGRRGARAVKKEAVVKEKKETGVTGKADTPAKQPGLPAKASGKTRSAGSRRVAVGRSVVNTGNKKPVSKKAASPEKEKEAKKPGKGFAPWNKNKFNKKRKEE